MVVRADGSTVGAVSGGCLEADIVARAAELLACGAPELAHYDTRGSDDGVLGLGTGLPGVIDVRLEPLAGDALDAGIERARELRERTAVRLLVCGGGRGRDPGRPIAAMMGWLVTVVDHRPSFATATRFPDAERVFRLDVAAEPARSPRRSRSTDSPPPSRWRTPRRTTAPAARRCSACRACAISACSDPAGARWSCSTELPASRPATLPANVFAPIGLDIGAETPEEIALAIVERDCRGARRPDGGARCASAVGRSTERR